MPNKNINDYLVGNVKNLQDAARAAAQAAAFGAAGAENEKYIMAAQPVAQAIEAGDVRMAILLAASLGATAHLETILSRVEQARNALR